MIGRRNGVRLGPPRALLLAAPLGVALIGAPEAIEAQSMGEVFRKVNPSVVVIRAKGQDVQGAGGLTKFNETGSGVLISKDGQILTAAHVDVLPLGADHDHGGIDLAED